MERTPFWNVMFYLGVLVIVVIAVFPFYYAVLTSFESGTANFRPNLLPEAFSGAASTEPGSLAPSTVG